MSDTPDWTNPATRINPTANLTATVASPGNVVSVDDTSGFRVGDTVAVTGQLSGSQQTYTNLFVQGIGSGQLTLNANLPVGLAMPGDVVGFPTVVVQPPINTAGVLVELAAVASGVIVPTQRGPMGWTTTNSFNPSTTPSIGETPGSGGRLVVTYLHAAINQSGANAYGQGVTLSGSSSGVKWQSKIAVPGTAGTVDRVEIENISVQFAVNETVTLAMTAALTTTVFGVLTMAGYQD